MIILSKIFAICFFSHGKSDCIFDLGKYNFTVPYFDQDCCWGKIVIIYARDAHFAYRESLSHDDSVLSREDLKYILTQGQEGCVVFKSVTCELRTEQPNGQLRFTATSFSSTRSASSNSPSRRTDLRSRGSSHLALFSGSTNFTFSDSALYFCTENAKGTYEKTHVCNIQRSFVSIKFISNKLSSDFQQDLHKTTAYVRLEKSSPDD